MDELSQVIESYFDDLRVFLIVVWVAIIVLGGFFIMFNMPGRGIQFIIWGSLFIVVFWALMGL